MPKWRKYEKVLSTRPIYEKELPTLIEKMNDDGLACFITDTGVEWRSGRYLVTPKVVRDEWNITKSQWKRVMDYIYRKNPWGDE
jgi:hypothetical protein